jgi:hypothetical protein
MFSGTLADSLVLLSSKTEKQEIALYTSLWPYMVANDVGPGVSFGPSHR